MNLHPVSTPDVQIRNALPTDEPTIYSFICTLEDTTLDRTVFQTIFAQNLINPSIYYFVAENADERIGFISCYVQFLLHHAGKVGEIQELFVQPNFRNQGIGQHLIHAIKKLAATENWVSLEVTTNQKRVDAIRFYERQLFMQTHVKLINVV